MSLLSYIIKTYVNGTTPALNATNMNSVETFLQSAHAEIAARNSNDVGIIIYHPAASIPDGWIKCDGTHYNGSAYPQYAPLYNVLGTTFGGNGLSDFATPDLRGLFIRGYDDGVGRDSGRTFASYQADDIKPHTHPYADDLYTGKRGMNYLAVGNHALTGHTTVTQTTVADATSESRPKNITFVPIIKYAAAALRPSTYVKNGYTAGYGTLPINATTRNHLESGLATARDNINSIVTPVGSMVWYPKYATPTGWFYCNGQAVSRTTYANLFNIIGTTYGTGDGSTTFNVPDVRGYFVRGADNMGTGARGVDPGRTIGTTQADQVASHTHQLPEMALPSTDYGSGSDLNCDVFSRSAGNSTTTANAGTEFRPKNVALIALIKY